MVSPLQVDNEKDMRHVGARKKKLKTSAKRAGKKDIDQQEKTNI